MGSIDTARPVVGIRTRGIECSPVLLLAKADSRANRPSAVAGRINPRVVNVEVGLARTRRDLKPNLAASVRRVSRTARMGFVAPKSSAARPSCGLLAQFRQVRVSLEKWTHPHVLGVEAIQHNREHHAGDGAGQHELYDITCDL